MFSLSLNSDRKPAHVLVLFQKYSSLVVAHCHARDEVAREPAGRVTLVLTVRVSTLVVVEFRVEILPSVIVVRPFRVEAVFTVRLSTLVVVELITVSLASLPNRVPSNSISSCTYRS